MSELEEKLGNLLSNPQLMQQVMAMARNLGGDPPPQRPQEPPAAPPPQIDPALFQALAGFARQSGVDENQQALLNALGPYLSQSRVRKLERAMRAAKLASFASGFLGSGGMRLLSGR